MRYRKSALGITRWPRDAPLRDSVWLDLGVSTLRDADNGMDGRVYQTAQSLYRTDKSVF